MKIAIVGPGRRGKDTASEWLAANTTLRYTGSTSSVILPHAAKELGLSLEAAWATRHLYRPTWRRIGDELRKDDGAALSRATLEHGDICQGVRSITEIATTISEGLVDLTIWINRPFLEDGTPLPADPTLEFGRVWADVVIDNDGSLAQFHQRLERLAGTWGVLCRQNGMTG